jgi:hypothetical protein
MITGTIRKLTAKLASPVEYQLPLGEHAIELNPLIGKQLTLTHTGAIFCSNCHKRTKKSYAQGFCYPCMQTLARCDICIVKPEKCHYAQGTCREPEWGEQHCHVPHYVYLANTSALKVGITRHSQLPTRWIDQGASQALPIFKVSSRLQSGLVETALAEFVSDKTNWRNMLKGDPQTIDLKASAQQLVPLISQQLDKLRLLYGSDAIETLDAQITEINYPVSHYLTKISSFNFDKTPQVSGILRGIKGQYLIFDQGVINMRKFTSYEITAEFSGS